MGSGLRALGNNLMQREFGKGQGRARIFLSHFHWDHIQGWPFFKPAYVPGNRFDLYSRHPHLQSRLKRQQSAPFFPPSAWNDMRADSEFHQLQNGTHDFDDGMRVSSITLDHPSKAYAYRFEIGKSVMVYASDSAYRAFGRNIVAALCRIFSRCRFAHFRCAVFAARQLRAPELGPFDGDCRSGIGVPRWCQTLGVISSRSRCR